MGLEASNIEKQRAFLLFKLRPKNHRHTRFLNAKRFTSLEVLANKSFSATKVHDFYMICSFFFFLNIILQSICVEL